MKRLLVISLLVSTLSGNQDTLDVTKTSQPQPPLNTENGKNSLVSGYNAPVPRNLIDSFHLFSDVSFLYWKAFQNEMQTYTLYSLQTGNGSNGKPAYTTEKYQTGLFDFEYRPGFQLGFGGDVPYNDWQVYTEYTWYHHRFSDSFVYNGPNSSIGTNAGYQANLFPAFTLKANNFTYFLLNPSTMLSTWDLHLNWLFLELARNYYVGKHLTFRTHFGLRADINHQKVTQKFNLAQEIGGTQGNNVPCGGIVRQWIHSWGIGPRVGMTVDYLLPYELKVFGNMAASLLYSQNTLKARQHSFLAYPGDYQTQTQQINESPHPTGHPNVEMGIGAGWGRSFHDNRWHLDLLLSYDLNALFDQNIFRELFMQITTADSGDGDSARVLYQDLYLYGLTAKVNLNW